MKANIPLISLFTAVNIPIIDTSYAAMGFLMSAEHYTRWFLWISFFSPVAVEAVLICEIILKLFVESEWFSF